MVLVGHYCLFWQWTKESLGFCPGLLWWSSINTENSSSEIYNTDLMKSTFPFKFLRDSPHTTLEYICVHNHRITWQRKRERKNEWERGMVIMYFFLISEVSSGVWHVNLSYGKLFHSNIMKVRKNPLLSIIHLMSMNGKSYGGISEPVKIWILIFAMTC